ncbi:MAG: hypothetical protein ABH823_03910, partial [bacterium]
MTVSGTGHGIIYDSQIGVCMPYGEAPEPTPEKKAPAKPEPAVARAPQPKPPTQEPTLPWWIAVSGPSVPGCGTAPTYDVVCAGQESALSLPYGLESDAVLLLEDLPAEVTYTTDQLVTNCNGNTSNLEFTARFRTEDVQAVVTDADPEFTYIKFSPDSEGILSLTITLHGKPNAAVARATTYYDYRKDEVVTVDFADSSYQIPLYDSILSDSATPTPQCENYPSPVIETSLDLVSGFTNNLVYVGKPVTLRVKADLVKGCDAETTGTSDPEDSLSVWFEIDGSSQPATLVDGYYVSTHTFTETGTPTIYFKVDDDRFEAEDGYRTASVSVDGIYVKGAEIPSATITGLPTSDIYPGDTVEGIGCVVSLPDVAFNSDQPEEFTLQNVTVQVLRPDGGISEFEFSNPADLGITIDEETGNPITEVSLPPYVFDQIGRYAFSVYATTWDGIPHNVVPNWNVDVYEEPVPCYGGPSHGTVHTSPTEVTEYSDEEVVCEIPNINECGLPLPEDSVYLDPASRAEFEDGIGVITGDNYDPVTASYRLAFRPFGRRNESYSGSLKVSMVGDSLTTEAQCWLPTPKKPEITLREANAEVPLTICLDEIPSGVTGLNWSADFTNIDGTTIEAVESDCLEISFPSPEGGWRAWPKTATVTARFVTIDGRPGEVEQEIK